VTQSGKRLILETPRELPWKLIAIWLVVSALAVFSCSLMLSAATLNGEYLPVGNDSFYHARRILDTVRDLAAFYEFDTKIHAPEGSLIPWPWGYDYVMALIVRGAMALGLGSDPMAILIWIPAVAVVFSIGLLIAIARQLRLSLSLTAIAALCMALSPTTQMLNGVGIIDHHYAEALFILATLATGLAWLRQPDTSARAIALAVTMGLAPAVQNGLFILQLPLLITLFVLWLQGRSVPARTAAIFASALLVATVLILLPSLPFRLGRFEFYSLSWFHFYIAMCTAVTVVLLSRLTATRKGIVIVLIVSAALLIPILRELTIASAFLAGTPKYLRLIGEMQPPYRALKIIGVSGLSSYYSYLIWIVPLTALLCAYKAFKERSQPRLLFWITSLIGLALLLSQLRMHYFGGFAMYLPWLILVQEYCERAPQQAKRAILLTTFATLLVYFPSLSHELVIPIPTANDTSFRETRPILESLKKACAKRPGTVLADGDLGHPIRYYTDCSTIANNFLLTPQHFRKVEEAVQLLSLSPEQLAEQAPDVRYVLVRPGQIAQAADGSFTYSFPGPKSRLVQELLFAPLNELPPEFVLIDEVRLAELDDAIYAKLYEIRRPGVSAPATSANDVGE